MRLTSTLGRMAVTAYALMFLFGSTAVADASHGNECRAPSIDRLQQWLASGEGATEPAAGSILVPQGRHDHTAKIKFLADDWAVMVVWLGNRFEAQADLSRSRGFWMTYRATDDLYVQLRPASHWSGGDKWVTKVPSTSGRLVKRFFSKAIAGTPAVHGREKCALRFRGALAPRGTVRTLGGDVARPR